MIRRLLMSLVMLAALGATAQGKWYSVPAGYVSGEGTLTIGAKAACNNGKGEKFTDFLKRFNSDALFRQMRSLPSENEPSDDLIMPYTTVLRTAAEVMVDKGFIPLQGFVSKEQQEGSPVAAGIWYVKGRDKVVYNTWRIDPSIEFDSNGAVMLFERIGGEWHFADCWPMGRLHEEVLERLNAE